MIAGREAIGAFWAAASHTVGNAKLTTRDVLPSGDGALVEIGTLSMQTKTEPPQPVNGKYVVLWVRVADQWKLQADIWNSDV